MTFKSKLVCLFFFGICHFSAVAAKIGWALLLKAQDADEPFHNGDDLHDFIVDSNFPSLQTSAVLQAAEDNSLWICVTAWQKTCWIHWILLLWPVPSDVVSPLCFPESWVATGHNGDSLWSLWAQPTARTSWKIHNCYAHAKSVIAGWIDQAVSSKWVLKKVKNGQIRGTPALSTYSTV